MRNRSSRPRADCPSGPPRAARRGPFAVEALEPRFLLSTLRAPNRPDGLPPGTVAAAVPHHLPGGGSHSHLDSAPRNAPGDLAGGGSAGRLADLAGGPRSTLFGTSTFSPPAPGQQLSGPTPPDPPPSHHPIGVAPIMPPRGPSTGGPGAGDYGGHLAYGPTPSRPPGGGGEPGGPLQFGGVPPPVAGPRAAPLDLATADPAPLTASALVVVAGAGAEPGGPPPAWWGAAGGPRPVGARGAVAVAAPPGPSRFAPLLLDAPVDVPVAEAGRDAAPPPPGGPTEGPGRPADGPGSPAFAPAPSSPGAARITREEAWTEGATASAPGASGVPASAQVAPFLAGLGGSSALLTGLLLPDFSATIRPVLDAHRRLRRAGLGRPPGRRSRAPG